MPTDSGSQSHDAGMELLRREGCLTAHTRLVGIDGINRIVEHLGNNLVVGDTQTEQGCYAQIGIEQLALFEHYLLLREQKGIEVRHKIREDVQEHLVKPLVELIAFLRCIELPRHRQQLGIAFVGCVLLNKLLIPLHLTQQRRL